MQANSVTIPMIENLLIKLDTIVAQVACSDQHVYEQLLIVPNCFDKS